MYTYQILLLDSQQYLSTNLDLHVVDPYTLEGQNDDLNVSRIHLQNQELFHCVCVCVCVCVYE
jgi:hypothetical protein